MLKTARPSARKWAGSAGLAGRAGQLGLVRLALVASLLPSSLPGGPGLAAARAADWQECLVTTSDYGTVGFAGLLQRQPPWQFRRDLEEISGDTAARYHGGLYYVINRGDDNIQVLDPSRNLRTLQQFSVGSGRTPYDIAFRRDGIAFVSCYDEAVLLKVDITTGRVVQTYSTAAWADADGLPETAFMASVGNRLYIACQRMDRLNWWVPAGGSCLLVFDMQQEAWVDQDPRTLEIEAIPLQGQNPSTPFGQGRGGTSLVIGCTGAYGALDGGIEEVDLGTGNSLGFLAAEAELGGDILGFDVVNDCLTYVVVSDPQFRTSIRTHDRCSQQVAVVQQADSFAHAGLVYDGAAYVYACERTPGRSGVWVFEAATGTALVSEPIPTGLAPDRVVLPVDAWPEAPSPVPQSGIWVEAPCPNPANVGKVSSRVRCHGPAGAVLPLAVYDLRGRMVDSASVELDQNGLGLYVFAGTGADGRRVAAGCYRIVAGPQERQVSCGLTLVR